MKNKFLILSLMFLLSCESTVKMIVKEEQKTFGIVELKLESEDKKFKSAELYINGKFHSNFKKRTIFSLLIGENTISVKAQYNGEAEKLVSKTYLKEIIVTPYSNKSDIPEIIIED